MGLVSRNFLFSDTHRTSRYRGIHNLKAFGGGGGGDPALTHLLVLLSSSSQRSSATRWTDFRLTGSEMV